MKVYIVRHGETDWNIAKRAQGQTDIELNENGIRLAEITSKAIKDLHFDYIFSSPLKRAYKTAEILRGDRKVPIFTDDRIKEICFGVYEGVPASERPEKFMLFFDAPEKYEAPEGGESYETLMTRTSDFLKDRIYPINITEPDANVLICGHGAMNKALIGNLLNRPISDMWKGVFQKNCCVNIIEVSKDGNRLIEEGKIFY